MKRSLFIWGALVLALGLALYWTDNLPPREHGADARTVKSGRSGSHLTKIENLTSKVWENGVLVSRLEADEFVIKPRRFYVFRIKSINEAMLKNVNIEFYLPHPPEKEPPNRKYRLLGSRIVITGEDGKEIVLPDEQGTDQDADKNIDLFGSVFKAVTANGKGSGTITGVSVEGIRLTIYKGTSVTHRLTAPLAKITFANRMLTFHNAVIENPPSGKIVKADRIMWDKSKNSFWIPGRYQSISPQGTKSGNGIRINVFPGDNGEFIEDIEKS